MILIVDDSYRKYTHKVREKIMSAGIPCAVTRSDNVDMFLPCAFVIVTERYILSDVEYMVRLCSNAPVILHEDEGDLFDFILSFCQMHCPVLVNGGREAGLSDEGEVFLVGQRRLKLTKTEKRIVKMLAYVKNWVSYEQLSLYCLKNGRTDKKSIAVHICNLNKKYSSLTMRDLVLCRRYSGYRIGEL